MERVAGILSMEQFASWSAAGRRICAEFDYRGRKHGPEPGHQLMWHGYDSLTKAILEHRIGLGTARASRTP